MKTSMKKRIVSAVLALAMVVSFLPANLFPKAEAVVFNGTLTITPKSDGSGGTFEATYTGGDATDAGNWYFALVPDITTGSSNAHTVSKDILSGDISDQTLTAT